eukprot:CAMPEP_0204356446 /NCGR_PEP_ID=MMETSP0469-20131031/34948_1 /ASSEMBLY_ACC=CAM_ASM_000384 /TAXON_ID=2969 /ORGANISM="Oxyrrhis marina" /LENGTH=498 /DNA_ID=CAMNT_0051343909 /DNA_START=1 /DNA_END=1497 /DNA_ORIENTATION=+
MASASVTRRVVFRSRLQYASAKRGLTSVSRFLRGDADFEEVRTEAFVGDATGVNAAQIVAAACNSPTAERKAGTDEALGDALTPFVKSLSGRDVHEILGLMLASNFRPKGLLDALARASQARLRSFSPFHLVNLVSRMSKLNLASHSFYEQSAEQMVDVVDQLSSFDISIAAFALSKRGYRDPKLYSAFAQRLTKTYEDVQIVNVGLILNAFSTVAHCDPELFHALSRTMLLAPPENCRPSDIALMLNACARCNYRKPRLFQVLSTRIIDCVDEFTPSDVTNCVHAFAKLDTFDHRVLHRLGVRAADLLSDFEGYELILVLHSFAKLRFGQGPMYECLFAELEARVLRGDELNSRSLTTALDAIRRKPVGNRLLLVHSLAKRLDEDLATCCATAATLGGWSLVELGEIGAVPGLGQRVLEHLRRSENMTQENLFHVRHFVKSYQIKAEMEYATLPKPLRKWCHGLFDTPTDWNVVKQGKEQGSRRSTRRSPNSEDEVQ